MGISLKNISYHYEKSNPILVDITTQFKLGKAYLLCGKNGAGKSTLANIISGLKKTMGGEIIFSDDIDFSDIGYQIQEFESFPSLKVKEVIKFWKKVIAPSKVDEGVLSEVLEIKTILDKKVKSLSGGEARALSIFLTCLMDKKIVILDEPFAGLDNRKKDLLSIELGKFSQSGKLLIIISHEVQGYESLFDYVTIMKNGMITRTLDAKNLRNKNLNNIINDEIWRDGKDEGF